MGRHGAQIVPGAGVFGLADCQIVDDGPVRIGDGVIFGSGIRILAEGGKEVTIGARAWIGNGAVVRPGVHIGEGALICANSVVEADVPAYAVVEGAPARVTWHLR